MPRPLAEAPLTGGDVVNRIAHLSLHGYTFVGKGTVRELVTALRHEAGMYEWLRSVQGRVVPVFLGSIDLDQAFHLTTGVWIVHVVLMS